MPPEHEKKTINENSKTESSAVNPADPNAC